MSWDNDAFWSFRLYLDKKYGFVLLPPERHDLGLHSRYKVIRKCYMTSRVYFLGKER